MVADRPDANSVLRWGPHPFDVETIMTTERRSGISRGG